MTGLPCGNNPHQPLTDGDRQAVAEFRAYLAARTDEQAATGRAAEVLAPLAAKANALRARQDAELRAETLRVAADRYAALVDQNEAYDREQGDLDEAARIQHETVRDVVAGLRRMADEDQPAVATVVGTSGRGANTRPTSVAATGPADEAQPNAESPVCQSDQGCHRVVPCDPGCGTKDLLAEATHPLPAPADQAAVERVRAVLETEAVVGRSALEYRGLIVSALMDGEAQPGPILAAQAPAVDRATVDRALDALRAGNYITARLLLESATSPTVEAQQDGEQPC